MVAPSPSPVDGVVTLLGIVIVVVAIVSLWAVRRKPSSSKPKAESKPVLSVARPSPAKVVLVKDKPSLGQRDFSDTIGTLWWGFLCFLVIVAPSALLIEYGVNGTIAVLFFLLPALMGVMSGYLLKRFRTSKAAREFDKDLKGSSVVAYHIGSDNRARLLGGRRGSTGRLHFPNMEILSDLVHKAAFPFYGTSSVIISTHMDTPVIPEFVEVAQQLLIHSDQIGGDGRKKDARELMHIIMELKKREDEITELKSLQERISSKSTTLTDYIDKKYHGYLFPDGVTLDKDRLKELTDQYEGYLANDGEWIKKQSEKVKKAQTVNGKETDFSFEFDKDMNGTIIGGHLIRNSVLNLADIRNLWPAGGTAEDAYLSGEHAKLGAQDMKGGKGWTEFMRWFGPFMIIVGFFIGIAILATVHVI